MVYRDCKIYGPYQGRDKRFRVVAVYLDGTKRTISYPKYLMEIKINRYLKDHETVDHLDTDVTNNSYENLVIKDRSLHISEDVKRYKNKTFICPECNTFFVLSGSKLNNAINNRRKGRAGPFCSRICSGKYGKNIQTGGTKLNVVLINPDYITNKSTQSLLLETTEVDSPKTGKP